jgi:hypothetical protein
MSPSEQAPGPRGSPQEPHGPAEGGFEDEDAPFAETANTESCGASFLLWHLGQDAFSEPYTKASNWWSHSLQMYSKIGMKACSVAYTRSKGLLYFRIRQ